MSEKFCKDCRFCKRNNPWGFLFVPIIGWAVWALWRFSGAALQFSKCLHAPTRERDRYYLVGCKPKGDQYCYASIEREDWGYRESCGSGAKFFEPRP